MSYERGLFTNSAAVLPTNGGVEEGRLKDAMKCSHQATIQDVLRGNTALRPQAGNGAAFKDRLKTPFSWELLFFITTSLVSSVSVP